LKLGGGKGPPQKTESRWGEGENLAVKFLLYVTSISQIEGGGGVKVVNEITTENWGKKKREKKPTTNTTKVDGPPTGNQDYTRRKLSTTTRDIFVGRLRFC